MKIKNQDLTTEFLTDDLYMKNLLYCSSYDLFYLYERGYYEAVPLKNFQILVRNFICSQHPELNITIALISDVVNQCKLGCLRKIEEIKTPYIALSDKLYNLETFELENFDKQKIATHKIDIPSNKLGAPAVLWQKFLEEILVDDDDKVDKELIDLIQEMFGYYLLNDLKAQKVFFLVGSGANGKSVMLHILEAMIGLEFVSAMSIQTLTMNQFATSSLIGKKVNICNEEESKYLRSDRFKALISGDLIDAERKHEQRFAFKPITKYIFASNQLPTFDGVNYGVKRRIIIVPFKKTFEEAQQDKNLLNKLLEELPGIMGWALKGSEKLVKNNYIFSESEAINESFIDFENAVSTAIMFLRENYKVDANKNPESFVPMVDLYQKYVDWCNKSGHKSMSKRTFGNDITYLTGEKPALKYHVDKPKRGRYLIELEEGISPEKVAEMSMDEAVKTVNMM